MTTTIDAAKSHDMRASALELGFLDPDPLVAYQQTHDHSTSDRCYANGYNGVGSIGHSIRPWDSEYTADINRDATFFNTVDVGTVLSAKLMLYLKKHTASGSDFDWYLSVRENSNLNEASPCDSAGYPLAIQGIEIATLYADLVDTDYAWYGLNILPEYIPTDRYTKIALVNKNDVVGTPPNGTYPAREFLDIELASPYRPQLILTLGSIYPTDPTTRVSSIVHRYNRAAGQYQLEVALGEVDVNVAIPYAEVGARSSSIKKEEEVKRDAEKALEERINRQIEEEWRLKALEAEAYRRKYPGAQWYGPQGPRFVETVSHPLGFEAQRDVIEKAKAREEARWAKHEARLRELGITPRIGPPTPAPPTPAPKPSEPSLWQKITPWKEEAGETLVSEAKERVEELRKRWLEFWK